MTALIKREAGVILPKELETEIVSIERSLKELKRRQDEIKAGLLEYMSLHGMTSIDTDKVKITKVEATDRETFDTKAFREEQPDQYNMYVKMTTVNPSIRITVR